MEGRSIEGGACLAIEKARPEQLAQIMEIYARARQFMAEHGNPNQWGSTEPRQEQIEEDITRGRFYVCMDCARIAAVFYYREGDDTTYDKIYDGKWIAPGPYGVVHRIASAGIVRGAGSFCVNWAFRQCGNLRIDTHRDNRVMQNMLEKNGFVRCGMIHLKNGDERVAYQKTARGGAEPEDGRPISTGLVLEGGGMRGIYTAGVLDVFMEHGIAFDGVLGVSAGAIHGCSYVSGQKGRSIRYYRKYCRDRRFMSFANVLLRGELVDTDFCYHQIPERLDPYDYDAFKKSGVKFYVGCSNLETGRPEYIQITDMRKQIDALRASASLPYVSHIVKYGGMKLLDGGCTDSIPLRAMMKMGYDKNVVVLTRDAGYVKPPAHVGPGHLIYCRYPRFVAAMSRRHRIYNRTVEDIRGLERQGRVFVICPGRELTISRTCRDPEELESVYELGRLDAEAKIEELKAFLA